MTTTTAEPSIAVSRWEGMSDFTRIAVGLSAGLSVMALVILISMTGPMVRAGLTWMHHLAWDPVFTHETVARGFLIALYGGVLTVGLAHARRTTRALAERRPKSEGKPEVGNGVIWAFWGVMVASMVAGALCGLFTVRPQGESIGPVVAAILIGGGILPWFLLAILIAIKHADSNTEPTCTGMVQTMGLAPGLLLTVMGFSVVNLGLLLGLWMTMALLLRLESNALPANYPYGDAPSEAPGSVD